MKKIGIVGFGNIGSTLCFALGMRHSTDVEIFVYDTNHSTTQGKIRDMQQAAILCHKTFPVRICERYEDMQDCDVCVITAGKPRQPGMTRDALCQINSGVIGTVGKALRDFKGMVIVVTNPVDVMTQYMQSLMADPKRVVGMAGLLDTARLRHAIHLHTGVDPVHIEGMVMGAHNDHMVPIHSSVTVHGKKWHVEQAIWQKVVQETRKGGEIIVSLLEKGSAFYGPAQAIMQMIDAFLYDKQCIMSCCLDPQGAYGISNICISIPVLLGQKGVSTIPPYTLSAEEEAILWEGVRSVQSMYAHC